MPNPQPGDAADPVESALEECAAALAHALRQLAARLRPFPRFPGSTWLEAVEVEPGPDRGSDWGCVVVGPDGSLQILEIATLGGPDGAYDTALVEQFRPLDLPPEQFIPWAEAAVKQLEAELKRRDVAPDSAQSA